MLADDVNNMILLFYFRENYICCYERKKLA